MTRALVVGDPLAGEAQREIVLWTTRDGREIQLDEMSDDHIANAVKVLSVWRSRLKKRERDDPIIVELALAVTRFKAIQRQRRKSAPQPSAPERPRQLSSRFSSRSSFGRPRKPVAST